MASNQIIPAIPRGFVRVEPDDKRYKNKFHVRSATSDSVYRISFDAAPGAGYWKCSCRGCISHGSCKHLEAIPLVPTRKTFMGNRIQDQKKIGNK